MGRRNLPPGTLLCLLKERQGTFYVHCPKDRASHTHPLVTLLGAQGDTVGQQGIKTQQLFLLLLDPQWTQHKSGIEPRKLLGQCCPPSPPLSSFMISRGSWGPIHHQEPPSRNPMGWNVRKCVHLPGALCQKCVHVFLSQIGNGYTRLTSWPHYTTKLNKTVIDFVSTTGFD